MTAIGCRQLMGDSSMWAARNCGAFTAYPFTEWFPPTLCCWELLLLLPLSTAPAAAAVAVGGKAGSGGAALRLHKSQQTGPQHTAHICCGWLLLAGCCCCCGWWRGRLCRCAALRLHKAQQTGPQHTAYIGCCSLLLAPAGWLLLLLLSLWRGQQAAWVCCTEAAQVTANRTPAHSYAAAADRCWLLRAPDVPPRLQRKTCMCACMCMGEICHELWLVAA
jgi:hypothetical protein